MRNVHATACFVSVAGSTENVCAGTKKYDEDQPGKRRTGEETDQEKSNMCPSHLSKYDMREKQMRGASTRVATLAYGAASGSDKP